MRALLNHIMIFWGLLAVPAIFWTWRLFDSGFDPATAFEMEHGTGELSARLMLLAMAISPLLALFGRRAWLQWLLRRRRAIGVASFGYAALHIFVYLIDYEAFNGGMGDVLEDAAEFSIWTGYGALLVLLLMALTSNNGAQKLMKRHWKTLQRLVYAAALMVALHWVFVDNEVLAAALHFIPLLILEIARVMVTWSRVIKDRFSRDDAHLPDTAENEEGLA